MKIENITEEQIQIIEKVISDFDRDLVSDLDFGEESSGPYMREYGFGDNYDRDYNWELNESSAKSVYYYVFQQKLKNDVELSDIAADTYNSFGGTRKKVIFLGDNGIEVNNDNIKAYDGLITYEREFNENGMEAFEKLNPKQKVYLFNEINKTQEFYKNKDNYSYDQMSIAIDIQEKLQYISENPLETTAEGMKLDNYKKEILKINKEFENIYGIEDKFNLKNIDTLSVFLRKEISVTPENIETFNKLIDNNLELTQTNIKNLQNTSNLEIEIQRIKIKELVERVKFQSDTIGGIHSNTDTEKNNLIIKELTNYEKSIKTIEDSKLTKSEKLKELEDNNKKTIQMIEEIRFIEVVNNKNEQNFSNGYDLMEEYNDSETISYYNPEDSFTDSELQNEKFQQSIASISEGNLDIVYEIGKNYDDERKIISLFTEKADIVIDKILFEKLKDVNEDDLLDFFDRVENEEFSKDFLKVICAKLIINEEFINDVKYTQIQESDIDVNEQKILLEMVNSNSKLTEKNYEIAIQLSDSQIPVNTENLEIADKIIKSGNKLNKESYIEFHKEQISTQETQIKEMTTDMGISENKLPIFKTQDIVSSDPANENKTNILFNEKIIEKLDEIYKSLNKSNKLMGKIDEIDETIQSKKNNNENRASKLNLMI